MRRTHDTDHLNRRSHARNARKTAGTLAREYRRSGSEGDEIHTREGKTMRHRRNRLRRGCFNRTSGKLDRTRGKTTQDPYKIKTGNPKSQHKITDNTLSNLTGPDTILFSFCSIFVLHQLLISKKKFKIWNPWLIVWWHIFTLHIMKC